ncbi:MAG: hypothetical protein FWF59_09545 [Turicibacter sp.]|nr:hypothetical protein [Turicibacter sp.]
MELTLFKLYLLMKNHLPTGHWWPAGSKLELIVGAILVQNTNWKNVEYSLANLKADTQFNRTKIIGLSLECLETLIRPSGFYKNKAKSILAITQWLDGFGEDYDAIARHYGDGLRRQLLALPGIGDETADVLMLYVFGQKAFISDKYAQRLLMKLGVADLKNYRETAKLIRLSEEFSVEDAKAFHGLIVDFGKEYLGRGGAWKPSFLDDKKLTLQR